MAAKIKQKLRKSARALAGLPLLGRIVRIGVAVIRLPETRALMLSLNGRQERFETQQLPTLLQAFSDITHRQLATETDKENLVKSVPIALRKITRDLIAIQDQLRVLPSALDSKLEELRGSVMPCIDAKVEELRGSYTPKLDEAFQSINYLMGRVEFVRRELMFELRYGASVPAAEAAQIKTTPEIVNTEKLAAARNERLRLNLGCGHIPLKDYLNVDRRALPDVDIVAEVDELPFGPGEVDEIYSAHLLEHFPQEHLRRELLPYCFSLLKDGGVFRAVVPDAEAMLGQYSKGRYPYDDMREVLYGAQDYDGDFHFNMFTPDSLSRLIVEAGFRDVEVLAKGRKNGKCFEFEVVGKK